MITVATLPTRSEAEIVKGMLASHGIPSILCADDAGGMRPYPFAYTYGVRIRVQKHDAQKAKNLLSPQTPLRP